jgi:hypothetical protein
MLFEIRFLSRSSRSLPVSKQSPSTLPRSIEMVRYCFMLTMYLVARR